ncbi:ArsR/SmtB family transcription factor [Desulfobulbus propionicus]|nr:metalloregulator ArsR/SmtB family transcription factor [Desulfobulbus propionicus]
MGTVDVNFSLRYFGAMQTITELFKSLSDETRLRLLILLQGGSEYCVCDLMNALDMPQSTVSRHLAYLKRNGWLQDRRGGVWMYYSLKKDMDAFLQAQLVLLINQLANNPVYRADKRRLEAYLQAKNPNSCK